MIIWNNHVALNQSYQSDLNKLPMYLIVEWTKFAIYIILVTILSCIKLNLESLMLRFSLRLKLFSWL